LPTWVIFLWGRTPATAGFGWGGVGGGGREWWHRRAQRHDPPPRPSPSRNRVYAGFGHSFKRSKSAAADFDRGEGEEAGRWRNKAIAGAPGGIPSPACGGGAGRGQFHGAERTKEPPPQPSPASGGGRRDAAPCAIVLPDQPAPGWRNKATATTASAPGGMVRAWCDRPTVCYRKAASYVCQPLDIDRPLRLDLPRDGPHISRAQQGHRTAPFGWRKAQRACACWGGPRAGLASGTPSDGGAASSCPPLWGRVGGGGRERRHHCAPRHDPPLRPSPTRGKGEEATRRDLAPSAAIVCSGSRRSGFLRGQRPEIFCYGGSMKPLYPGLIGQLGVANWQSR
jgi:hypothetical protein